MTRNGDWDWFVTDIIPSSIHSITKYTNIKLHIEDYKKDISNYISKISDRYNIDKGKINILTDEIKSFDVVHPGIGENYSYLNIIRKKQNLVLNFILSEEDKFSWQFSNKGYFNFKNNIPKILTNFNLQ